MRKAKAMRKTLDSVLVCSGLEPPLELAELPPGCRIEGMDLEDRADIERWIAIHNDAYGRHIGYSEYLSGMVEHPHYDIRRALFLLDAHGPLGAASAGVFRRNQEIGVAHYIAIVRRGQGLGMGRALAQQQVRAAAELGVRRVETETQIGRTASLCLQFALGFALKYRFDHWNTPDTASPPLRTLTNVRLRRLHRSWAARHASGRSPGTRS